jgi:2-methylisocitrate lyase-like PEP mutase family enzyme
MIEVDVGSRPGARATWKALLDGGPLLLPAAHDALTARLIARAGFRAYQVGGFALAGARYAFPDVDLVQFYEEQEAIRQIVATSGLPVMVDAGDGFGDVKNVTRTVCGYEEMGAGAIFIEDQKAPFSCGQMGKKEVVEAEVMVGKIQAALAARHVADTYIMARTDARSADGVAEAIRRAKQYRDAGADGVYVEGLRSAAELKRVGKALHDTPGDDPDGGRLPVAVAAGGGDLRVRLRHDPLPDDGDFPGGQGDRTGAGGPAGGAAAGRGRVDEPGRVRGGGRPAGLAADRGALQPGPFGP